MRGRLLAWAFVSALLSTGTWAQGLSVANAPEASAAAERAYLGEARRVVEAAARAHV